MVVLALVHSEHEAARCIVVGHGCNNLVDSVNAGRRGLLELAVDARLDNALSVVVTGATLAELVADDAHQQGGERGVACHTFDDLLKIGDMSTVSGRRWSSHETGNLFE